MPATFVHSPGGADSIPFSVRAHATRLALLDLAVAPSFAVIQLFLRPLLLTPMLWFRFGTRTALRMKRCFPCISISRAERCRCRTLGIASRREQAGDLGPLGAWADCCVCHTPSPPARHSEVQSSPLGRLSTQTACMHAIVYLRPCCSSSRMRSNASLTVSALGRSGVSQPGASIRQTPPRPREGGAGAHSHLMPSSLIDLAFSRVYTPGSL